MFNAGLQKGKEGKEGGGQTGNRGLGGVPSEISLHLSLWEMEVDEYQPLKWASDANGAFILAWLCSIHLPNNWWR